MSLFVDKYRPSQFSKLDYHRDQAERLAKLVHAGDFPHLLVFGPSGAGKKTRIMCVLRELYGAGVEKRRIEHKNFEAPSGRKLEITLIASNYHIELNASDVGIYDRVVIQEVIKTMAQTHQLDTTSQREFKVVLLTQVDRLTRDAQHALRRTMEKYSRTCRLILCCKTTSKLIPALRSRCLAVRVPAPSESEIMSVLNNISRKEGLQLPIELSQRISVNCQGNLRRAVLMLEVCRVHQFPLSADQKLIEPEWELYLKETANLVLQEQSPKRLLEVRQRIYELLTHCIPADVIYRGLVTELVASLDSSLKIEVTELAATYEHRQQLGNKAIFHIEAFLAKFMTVYKRFLEETLSFM